MATCLPRSVTYCSIAWGANGNITEIRVAGQEGVQSQANQFFLNGETRDRAFTRRTGEHEVTQSVEFTTGVLELIWRGGAQLEVTVAAEAKSGEIREAGFSLGLPACVARTMIIAEDHSWDGTQPGSRLSLDTFAFGIGNIFLMEASDWCMRIGRQVDVRRDYTTGYLERTEAGWDLVWKWEPQTPFPSRFTAQPLQLAVFPSRKAALEDHRHWMEKQYGAVPRERNPKIPDWFKKTRIIFQVVVGETNGAIVHDYKDIANLIEDLQKMGVPEETILYIPDYNFASLLLKNCNGPVVCLWPENPLLGGEAAFREMIAAAKKYRYHIMPHSSIVLLISEYLKPFPDPDGEVRRWINPEWDHLQQWALRYRNGDPHVWPMEGPSPQYP